MLEEPLLCFVSSTDPYIPKIVGMVMIDKCLHNKYGSAVFVRDDLKVKSMNVDHITVVLPGMAKHSVYKPLNEHCT